MKDRNKYWVLLLLALSSFFYNGSLQAQNPQIIKANNNNLSYILNNIRTSFTSETKTISVKLYQVSNKSGSAKQPETDEVTDNLYVAISEFDEQPKQMLFVIKNVYAPKNITLSPQPDQKIKLTFVYKDKGQPQKYTATLSSTGVEE